MDDPVWLDSNAVSYALEGDAAVNEQLAAYRKAGRQLLIVPAVANEVLNGNVLTMRKDRPVWQQTPSPQLKSALQTGMNKLGIQVDWSSSALPRSKRVDYSQIPTSIKVSESDRLVMGQVKASAEARGIARPLLITGERAATKPMFVEASKWGIESIPTAKPVPGSVPAPPRINLADYPSEKEGPIARWFKDRPVLKKLGLVGANMAAQYLSQQALAEVEEHFASSLRDARQEFETKYPTPFKLKVDAHLDRYRQAYEAALSKLTALSRAKAMEALVLGTTPTRDIDRMKKFLDDQISKVQSAADGSMSGYSKVANEYIEAMIAVYKQVSPSEDLGEIAADIKKRGSILKSTGDSLEATFLQVAPKLAGFPVAYYLWFDLHNVASVFTRLGGVVLAFSSDINDLNNAYSLTKKQLDEQLTKVSNELAQYAP